MALAGSMVVGFYASAQSQSETLDAESLEGLQRLCDGNTGRACVHLGHRYAQGIGGAFESQRRAFKWFQHGCDLGDMLGCVRAGGRYYGGWGTKKDRKQALSLFEQACAEGRAETCTFLGLSYLNGHFFRQDTAKALSYLERGCEADYHIACLELGLAYIRNRNGIAKDRRIASDYLQKACITGRKSGACLRARIFTAGE